MTARETRALSSSSIEVRESVTPGRPKLVGWAAVWDSPSLDLGGFREIVRKGCFRASLDGGADVRAYAEHDPRLVLGRRTARTLDVAEDDRGLRFEINPPDTQVARDLVKNIRAGNITGASFAFRVRPGGERWDMTASPPLRELTSLDLFDVAPVSTPAYSATEVGIRSMRGSEGNHAHAAVLAELAEARQASRRLGTGLVQRGRDGTWRRWFRSDRDRRTYVAALAEQERRRRATLATRLRRAVLSHLSQEVGTR
jgi:HK97 family phage prohead protease